jgi:nitrite reductase/ring-hydroxylating ferredoxin subunit
MAKVIVAAVDDVPCGTQKRFEVSGRAIVVFNVDGEFYALRDVCPHQGAPLSAGVVVGSVTATAPGCYDYEGGRKLVRCPWHGWEYDLDTGQSWFSARSNRVVTYPVSVEAGQALAEQSGNATAKPGPYVAETIPLAVEDDYLVVDMPGSRT